jgi:hypothetical protein
MDDAAPKHDDVYSDTEDSALAQAASQRKVLTKKRRTRIIGGAFFLCILSFAIYWLFLPVQGGIAFGICKTFLELNIPYPPTLRLGQVLVLRDGSLRVWFNHTDAFGEFRMEPFECTYKTDEKTGNTVLASAKMGKVVIDPKAVEGFNLIIPYLVQNPPDLTLPDPLPSNIGDLQVNSTLFRRRLTIRKVQ